MLLSPAVHVPRKELPPAELDSPDVYLPDLEEIRAMCEIIQSGWSEEERIYRTIALPWELSGTAGTKHQKNRLACRDCGKAFVAWRAKRCPACTRRFNRADNLRRAHIRWGKAVAK